ncbi:MAG: ATP-binding protein [Anaerolineales bacterium]
MMSILEIDIPTIRNRILEISHSGGSVQHILQESLDALVEQSDAEVGAAYLVDEGMLSLEAAHGLDSQSVREKKLNLTPFLDSAPNIRSLEGETGDHLIKEVLPLVSSMSILSLPLTHREPLGYLFVGLPSSMDMEEQDLDLLHCIGQILGLAIENAQLRERLAREGRQSQTIYDISRAFMSTTTLDDLLDLIVHSAVDTIEGADNCVLHLFDQESGELDPRALSFAQARPHVESKSHLRIGRGVAGVALQKGRVMNVPDVSRDARFVPSDGGRSFVSMMAAPLKLGDRRIGTLSVDSRERDAFSDSDGRLLMTLATQAAAAIENARLVSDLQESLEHLKSTQDQLIQSEKLSALGQLIAGVAHELNNPLTAIMGYTQILQRSDRFDKKAQEDLKRVHTQAQRAAEIVENLLTFARQHRTERQYVDVNEIIERTLELRSYQLYVENVEIVRELDENPPRTMADASQMQQVFLNLINNALDAMIEHAGGGTLTIRSQTKGDSIQVSVSDTGPGLSSEAKKHLFEPFFTTKEVGKGTGLGLSICFGIIDAHNGRIWAEDPPGEGATFIIQIPIVTPTKETKTETNPVPPVTKKRILIVEDDDHVASVLERLLSQDGHDTLWAQDGTMALKALARAKDRDETFDLMISDVKMPKMSGTRLYERVSQQDPELARRTLFITGDTMSSSTREFLRHVGLPYLTKPFEIQEMRLALDRLLRQS